ncbi:hypothetical protein BOSE21B_111211 [Bosea sp. 21B]|nr:hypothetical protein BOSE21B_111211 [Bosea sp. 21B]
MGGGGRGALHDLLAQGRQAGSTQWAGAARAGHVACSYYFRIDLIK